MRPRPSDAAGQTGDLLGRQWWGRALSLLLKLLVLQILREALADEDTDVIVQKGRALFGGGSHGGEVADDLHRGADDAPGKSPPTDYAAKEDCSPLAFGGTAFAGELWLGAP